jgi:Uma2 family endonuclease
MSREVGDMSTALKTTPLLKPGQRLTRSEFMRRWEAMPELKRAELIYGVVYMPSPLTCHHGEIDTWISAWIAVYTAHTPGCRCGGQATWLMLQSAPQPDSFLWIVPECGGQSIVKENYHTGAPELVVEVCYTSGAYDLGVKKRLYEEAGVQEYVAVLVTEQEVRWHRLTEDAFKVMEPDSRGVYKSTVFPGLWLDSRALWKHDLPRILKTLERGLHSADHKAFVKALAAAKLV